MQKDALWTRNFLSLCFSSFFLFITFYSLLTALPFFVLDELHESQETVGLVVSAFLIASVIIRPFAGQWLDTIGRKKILVLSLVLLLLISFLYLFVHSYVPLLALRFVQGIGFGIATTAAGAISADIVPPTRRGEGIGYYGMFMNMSMVIGPYLGLTIIQHYSFSVLFIACILFAIASFVLGLSVKVPFTNKLETKNNKRISFKLKDLFEPTALPIAIVGCFLAFAYSGILSFVSLFATSVGLEAVAGYFFIVYALVMIISRPFTGRWFDLYGENKIIYPALVLFVVGMIILSFSSSAWIYLLAAAVIGLGYGVLFPSFQTISIQNATPATRGAATATYLFFYDLGVGIGAYVNGVIVAKASYHSMYLISAGVLIVTIALYKFVYDRKKHLLHNHNTEKAHA